MEKMNDLRDLLKHEVQDLMSAEQQIIEALPSMIEKASNPTLKKGLQEHLQVTEMQKKRCERVLDLIDANNQSQQGGFLSGLFGGGEKVCKGMQGLIKEGEKILGADIDAKVLDAAIIACAQKIEHYEICGYGTVRAYAIELGLEEVSKLLEQTLNEEYDADDLLTTLAYGGLNREAEGRSAKRGNGSVRSNGAGRRDSNNNSGGGKNGRSKTNGIGNTSSRNKTANKRSSKSASVSKNGRSTKSSSSGKRKTAKSR